MGNTPWTQIGPFVVVPVCIPRKQRSSCPESLRIWSDGCRLALGFQSPIHTLPAWWLPKQGPIARDIESGAEVGIQQLVTTKPSMREGDPSGLGRMQAHQRDIAGHSNPLPSLLPTRGIQQPTDRSRPRSSPILKSQRQTANWQRLQPGFSPS